MVSNQIEASHTLWRRRLLKNGRKTKNSVQIYDKKQQNSPNNKTQQKLSPSDIRKKRAINFNIGDQIV